MMVSHVVNRSYKSDTGLLYDSWGGILPTIFMYWLRDAMRNNKRAIKRYSPHYLNIIFIFIHHIPPHLIGPVPHHLTFKYVLRSNRTLQFVTPTLTIVLDQGFQIQVHGLFIKIAAQCHILHIALHGPHHCPGLLACEIHAIDDIQLFALHTTQNEAEVDVSGLKTRRCIKERAK